MAKNLFTFLGTFIVGALIALVARAAMFKPHAHTEISAAHTDAPASAHAAHPTAPSKPVNTVCAICGMDVDPTLPTATYQGQTIGFGCRMCPPKFQAAPDKYGPAYLQNKVLEN